jgi:hypothetical protein
MLKEMWRKIKMQLNYQIVFPTFIKKEMCSRNPRFREGGGGHCLYVTDLG